jgi:hypothetical protein
MPVAEACGAFMSDVAGQRLSESSLKKYRVLLVNKHGLEEREKFSPSLVEFCGDGGLQFTNQITLAALTRFRGQWKDGALSGGKKLERLCALADSWWIEAGGRRILQSS